MKTRNALALLLSSAFVALTPGPAWKNAIKTNPTHIVQSTIDILRSSTGESFSGVFKTASSEGFANNTNPAPPRSIYPRAAAGDATYSIAEDDLRQTIHIPSDFTFGQIQPVIFIPGTGATAGRTFAPNIGKLLKRDGVGDPVYLNIPYTSLNDVATNGEHVAYAINYISALCGGKQVATISWSQGSLNGQHAFTFWPSTRALVSDAIRLSPDVRGTVLTRIFGCPGLPSHGCVTSIAQQDASSPYLARMHALGADAAYVPSTHVYSVFDEIVQPQFGERPSGAIADTRNVGVSNTQLQSVCAPFLPGGAFFNSHAGLLHSSLAYALVVDALTHPGPADLARVDVPYHCAQWAAPGLNLRDVFETAALIPLAAISIFAHKPKVRVFPPLADYINEGVPQ